MTLPRGKPAATNNETAKGMMADVDHLANVVAVVFIGGGIAAGIVGTLAVLWALGRFP